MSYFFLLDETLEEVRCRSIKDNSKKTKNYLEFYAVMV